VRLAPRILDADRKLLVEHARPLFESVRDCRFFVTGGTGFFGCWLLEALTAACDAFAPDLSVTVLTRSPEAFRARAPLLAGHPAVRLVAGDVRDFVFPAEGYPFVIHAAFDSSREPSPEETRSTIIEGTARCLEFARRAETRRFLFVSSGAVYGRQPADVPRRSEEVIGGSWPRTAYGAAKGEGERLAFEAADHGGPAAIVARGFAFVGPRLRLDGHFAIGNFIRDAISGGPIRVAGDGSPVRSYLYAADLAIWLLTVLFRGAPGTAYNVGSEDAVTVAELARIVAEAIAPDARVEIAKAAKGMLPDRYVPSTERARKGLGLRQTVDLAEAIRRTAAWHRVPVDRVPLP